MEPNYIFSFINGIREIFPERKTFEQGRAVPDSSKWLSEWNSTYTCFFFSSKTSTDSLSLSSASNRA